MKVKDVVKISATHLNMPTVVEYCNNGGTIDQEILKEVEKLTLLTNLVVTELSEAYIPVNKVESVVPKNRRVEFSALKHNPIKIVGVFDGEGREIDYKLYGTYVEGDGIEIISYQYVPPVREFEDDLDYDEGVISTALLALGLSAEYCLTIGRFDEAVMWRKRFVAGVKEKICPKNRKIKGRNFYD